ncbi:putative glycine-rich protein [Rhodobacteraceae bacterium KLH11]|nr:putative glycine-rich protein [Rhodobacteraceae bacterium KLH11]
MRIKSKLLSVVFASAALPIVWVGPAQAAEMCTVKTARQSVSSDTLCACDTVSTRMLRYLQRRADFEDIIERTLVDCPGFAAVLTDLPTASIGFAEQRSGDGRDDETFGGDGGDDGGDGGDGGGTGGGGGGTGGGGGGTGGGGGGTGGGGPGSESENPGDPNGDGNNT